MLIPVSLLLVCLVGFFMLKQVNLFLGVEKQVTLDVISTEQIGKGPGRRFAMAFKDKWGGHFRQTFRAGPFETLSALPGDKIDAITDGLLWTVIVRVDRGDGYKKVYF